MAFGGTAETVGCLLGATVCLSRALDRRCGPAIEPRPDGRAPASRNPLGSSRACDTPACAPRDAAGKHDRYDGVTNRAIPPER
eukprot:4735048-Prymnesium_polylepis.1